MIHRMFFFALASLLALSASLHAQPLKNPQTIRLFREVIAKPSESIVRVRSADKDAALGVIVSADGWILSKHSELQGGKITCKLRDGRELDAEMFGYDTPFDLVMLKIDAKELTPIVWTESKVSRVGHFVASPGDGVDPVAIGVVSVNAREVKGAKLTPTVTGGGYLGIALDFEFAGVKIQEVLPGTPAQKSGLKNEDQILSVNGQEVQNSDEFFAVVSKGKPGDNVDLKIVRNEKEQELKITLGTRPGQKGGKSRGDVQNSMGSKLSDRRTGFPIILQHDSVLKPNDCGGPLVNLDGKVLGINIARAGRTESYAIPSEAIRPLLERLKIKNLEPKKNENKLKV